MSFDVSNAKICNMALSRIGQTQTITDIDTDTTAAADQARLWFAFCRDELAREFNWAWSSRYITLSQVSENGVAANAEWQYSYRYPTDCLWVVRMIQPQATDTAAIPQTTGPVIIVPTPLSPDRIDTNPYPWPFELGSDDDGLLIYTDLPQATCKYTASLTNPEVWASDFADLLAWRLAIEFASGLAISDVYFTKATRSYETKLRTVRARAANEAQISQPIVDYNSEFIRARQDYTAGSSW